MRKNCTINDILQQLILTLSETDFNKSGVIPWAAPIISFGNLEKAEIATLGLNPSNLEFVDHDSNELTGQNRRFHTLSSLGVESWLNSEDNHLESINNLCMHYFENNPYDTWFKKLDSILAGGKYSYYFPYQNVCHLDLVPFATIKKWNDLNAHQKKCLIKKSKNSLGLIIRHSSIQILVLNGQSVIDNFCQISNCNCTSDYIQSWDLPRNKGLPVKGKSFMGYVSKIGDVEIKRKIKIIGYNHNIQSSYGISKKTIVEIRKWIKSQILN